MNRTPARPTLSTLIRLWCLINYSYGLVVRNIHVTVRRLGASNYIVVVSVGVWSATKIVYAVSVIITRVTRCWMWPRIVLWHFTIRNQVSIIFMDVTARSQNVNKIIVNVSSGAWNVARIANVKNVKMERYILR